MDILGDLKPSDCDGDKLFFTQGEVIEFVGLEPRVDEQKGHIFIKGRVLNGINEGKEHTIMLAGGDHEMSRKHRAMFFFRSGFWTEEELTSRSYKLSKIIGAKYSARAGKVTERNGEKFQNFSDIKYLGDADPSLVAGVDGAKY